MVPVSCPLKCGEEVKRERMKWHLSEEGNCPKVLLCCPFKDSGCSAKVERDQLGKHLTDNMIDHQVKQQIKISQLEAENENQKLEIKELQDESKQSKLKIKELQNENGKLKERLNSNEDWLISNVLKRCGPGSPAMLSRCGQAVMRLHVDKPTMICSTRFTLHYESKPFLACRSGILVKVEVDFPSNYPSTSTTVTTTEAGPHLTVSLIPVPPVPDFTIRYTIKVIDQQDDNQDITKTVKSNLRLETNEGDAMPCHSTKTLPKLCVPQHILLSRKYVKNNTIIIYVDTDQTIFSNPYAECRLL
jgi:hypothetical protein